MEDLGNKMFPNMYHDIEKLERDNRRLQRKIRRSSRKIENVQWTRTDEESFQARPGLKNTKIHDWKKLSEEDYRKLFKNSAIKRTKYSGLMRNIKANLD